MKAISKFQILLFLIFLNGLNLSGQDKIMNLVQKSNQLENDGKIEESIIVSKELIDLMPESNVEIIKYSIAQRYGLIHELDSAFYYLKTSTILDSSLRSLGDSDFYYLLNDSRWREHENSILDKYELKNGRLINRDYVIKLLRLKIKDQAFFSHIKMAEKKNDKMSYYAFWELKTLIKEDAYEEFKNLNETYGYPNNIEYPKECSKTAFLIIQHLEDLEEQTKYLAILEKAAKNKEIEFADYAYLLDRVNMRNGKPQIYGTQIKNNELYNLYKPEEVNKRREEVGMGPIEEYLSKMGIEQK